MICEREKLDAYVDGELAAAESSAMEAHLESCASCSAEALARMQLKRCVRAAAFAYQPSAEFRNRIAAQIAPQRRQLRFLRNPALLAAISVALIVAIAAPLLARHYARERAVAELLDLHVATLASANPVDVLSSDRHTVKPWFQGKLPFTFNLPELGNSPFKLIGGRLIYFDHDPGAQLLFSLRQHRFSVFIVQKGAVALPTSQTEQGFSVESWITAGLRYSVVSDAAPADVHSLADLLRNAQSQ
jgi:anti-sigma factor RsiW